MATPDTLPVEITTHTRNEWRDLYLRSYANRLAAANPSVDVTAAISPDGAAWIKASAQADTLVILSSNAAKIASQVPVSNQVGDRLAATGEFHNVYKNGALGSSGVVRMQASSNGTVIQANDVLTDTITKLSFKALTTTAYADGELVSIQAIDTGAATNCAIDTPLMWQTLRAGCFATAFVDHDTNGNGLVGGVPAESDDDYLRRIQEAMANPRASGNEATVISLTEEAYPTVDGSRPGHGVQVAKGFVYPCILGPGTMGITFVVQASGPGGTRIPSSTQVSIVGDYVKRWLPGDDSLFVCPLTTYPVTITFQVDWDTTVVPGWADQRPWPPYVAHPNTYRVSAAGLIDSLHFTIEIEGGNYSSAVQPKVGQAMSVYDVAHGMFQRKTIATGGISGTGPWGITCDNIAGASDATYEPTVNSRVMPWSDSLNDVADAVTSYMRTFGPGEQATDPGDDGAKLMRQPRPTARKYPIMVTNIVTADVQNLASVSNCSLVGGNGSTTPIGTPGTFSYMFENPILEVFSS